MGWRNIEVPIFNIPQSFVTDFSWMNNREDSSNKVETNWILPESSGVIINSYALGKASDNYSLWCQISNNTNFYRFYEYVNGSKPDPSMYYQDVDRYNRYDSVISYIAVVDDENELGYLIFISRNTRAPEGRWAKNGGTTAHITNDMYELLTNAALIYNWHAVESIEGKLGTFDLTKIFDEHINDGDPVSNANVTNVDTGDDSVVMNLIKNVISNDDLVTVYYTIPQNDYQYVKLVYKKDTEPANENDGTVINIDEESTNHIVSGITTGDVYWFVIFTDKDKSIPYQFGTNKTIWAGEEIDLMYRGNYCKLTVQIANEHILFKIYDHSNVIYSWNAIQGTTVDDAYNIYVQFTEETTQQLAKPSMVYYNNDSYSYNQESPSQSEMQDIWNWLHGDDNTISTANENWQSVQSISGKMGTFNLVQTGSDYMSDGEARSGQSASVFTSLPNNMRVRNLADNSVK